MAYRPSPALAEWKTARRANIDELRRAHALVGNAGPGSGAGRPPKAGTQQLNEALVVRVVTEFQGFVRDLLDLVAIRLVRGSGASAAYQALLIAAASRDRMIDRGNPHLEAIRKDAARLGVPQLGVLLSSRNPTHGTDAALLKEVVEFRNALAHDDQDRLQGLSRQGIRATVAYSKRAQAAVGRLAAALDHVMWDHLLATFPGTDPWSP